MTLTLSIKNIGPIKEAQVTLRPLTIITGPNLSGKSILATMIHAIHRTHEETISPPDQFFLSKEYTKAPGVQSIVDNLARIVQNDSIDLDSDSIDNISHQALQSLYNTALQRNLEYLTASTQQSLHRIGEDTASITLSQGTHTITITYPVHGTPEITGEGVIQTPVMMVDHHEHTIQIKGSRWRFTIPWYEAEIYTPPDLDKTKEEANVREFAGGLIQTYAEMWVRALSGISNEHSYYLPASRSGFIQAHRALSAGFFSIAARAGTQKVEIPILTGIVADFIRDLNQMPGTKGIFQGTWEKEEKTMIQGRVTLQTGQGGYPEFLYTNQDGIFPVHRVSSAISEIGPLFLYLNHLVQKGDLLIIEEPEAHLHPGMQRVMAQILTKIIRSGVRIVITTHSDYLISQLSNHIILHRQTPERREEISGDPHMFLSPDEVSVYSMVPSDTGGYETKEVQVNDEDGISSEEFLQITESLYDEIVKIHQDNPEQ